MNLPSGKALKINLDLASTDVSKLIEELRAKRATGYLALCIKSQKGIEEATLLIDAGKIVGAIYEYYAYAKEYAGEKAFQRFLNASACKHGLIDIFEATPEQIHLVLAFHDEAVFVPSEETLRHVKVTEFSPFYEEEARKDVEKTAGVVVDDASRKYKLYPLVREEPKVSESLPKAEEKA